MQTARTPTLTRCRSRRSRRSISSSVSAVAADRSSLSCTPRLHCPSSAAAIGLVTASRLRSTFVRQCSHASSSRLRLDAPASQSLALACDAASLGLRLVGALQVRVDASTRSAFLHVSGSSLTVSAIGRPAPRSDPHEPRPEPRITASLSEHFLEAPHPSLCSLSSLSCSPEPSLPSLCSNHVPPPALCPRSTCPTSHSSSPWSRAAALVVSVLVRGHSRSRR